MAITLAYIYGYRSGKKVTFTGSPQTDGYVYFNDENFYRCRVPSGDAYNTDYNLNDVQIWYTVRNCWIRANFFDSLKLRYFSLVQMYEDIENLKTRMTAVENRCTQLEQRCSALETRMSNAETAINDINNLLGANLASVISPYSTLAGYLDAYDYAELSSRTNSLLSWVNQLGRESLGSSSTTGNGENLLDTINQLNNAISEINFFHSTSLNPIYTSVHTTWNDKSF